jgi:hypothetical protein
LLRNWRLKPLAAAIVAAGTFGSGDDRAASLVVATLSEHSASACTLRDALDSVNAQADRGQCVASGGYGSGDAVTFASGLSGTITFFSRDPLSSPVDPSALVVRRPVSIQGPGSGQLALACGNVFYRLLEIDAGGGAVSVSGLAMTGCTTHALGGGARVMSNTFQSVQFTDVTLSNNSANQGGGLGVFGGPGGATVTLTACNILGNRAQRGGGAYASGATAEVTFTQSTLAGNRASSFGGGMDVENGALATVFASTLSGNQATAGGGGASTFSAAGLTATNSTLSGNTTAGSGGGVLAVALGNSALVLANSTIANNRAGGGGGVAVENTFPVGQMTPANAVSIVDTLVVGNTAPSDTLSSEAPGNVLPWNVSYSAIGAPGNIDLVGTGNITGAAVPPPFGTSGWLGPLQNNGGPTQTQALLTSVPDPAVNAGDPAFSGLAFDQRGSPFLRVHDGRVDIGAYETQSLVSVAVPGPRGLALSLLAGLLGLLTWWRSRPR